MALFENFPYTNIHELNLDWIVKIAKDFLEQYTHIQQLITDGETSLTNLTETGLTSLQDKTDTGLADLQAKADALEAALQAWYETHSEDIAQQLTNALADLVTATNNHKNEIADYIANLIAALPADYTEALNRIQLLTQAYDDYIGGRYLFMPDMINSTEGYCNNLGYIYETPGYKTSIFIPVEPNTTYYCNFTMSTTTGSVVALHRTATEGSPSFIKRITSGGSFTTTAETHYIRFSMPNENLSINNIYTDKKYERFETRTIQEVNALYDIAGYTSISPVDTTILDDDAPISYDSVINFTTNRITITGNIAISNSKPHRLYYLTKLKSNRLLTGIQLNGIYNNGVRISTPLLSAYVLENSYIFIGYLDVTTETPDAAQLSLAITTSAPASVTIEKFETLSNYTKVPTEYLEVGSGKTYASFTSAFNYAKLHPLTNFIIRLFGWYEMNGSTDDLTTESGGQGCAVPANIVKIIGNDRRDTNVINFTGSTLQAPFYLLYSVDIENIYFITRCKYAILIDDPRNKSQIFNVKGCKFKHISGGSGAIGIGMHECEINITENYFEQSTDSGIRAHNWDYGNSFNQHLNIIGNYFTDDMVYAIHLFTVNRRNGMGYARAIINENYFSNRTIMLSEEDYTQYGEGNLWEVWGHNNSETSVEIMHRDDADHRGLVNIFMPDAIVTDTKIV